MVRAKIIAVDELTSKKGTKYWRLWVVTKDQPRPMRIVAFKPNHNVDDYVDLIVQPNYQCDAEVRVVE